MKFFLFHLLFSTLLAHPDFFPSPRLPEEWQTSCDAEKAIFDPKHHTILFEKFSGSLPFQHGEDLSKIHIASEKANLDKLHQTFFLWDKVVLDHIPHFQLFADKMRISQLEDQSFFLHGEKMITLELLEKMGSTIKGDEISWKSNEERLMMYGAPLHLVDPICDLYCKKALLKYQKEEGSFQVEKILLTGDIQLHYHDEKITSYGIAETISFDPKTKELIMEGKRVLFCNEEDTLRISAPKIIIEKGEAVKGEGDVHFTFSEDEKKKFNQQFSKFLHLR